VTRILVTGASGFIGRTVCDTLLQAGFAVRAAVRAPELTPRGAEPLPIPDITTADWTVGLREVEHVIHAAARAHAADPAADPAGYGQVNAEATGRLAQAAALAGVQRFVYLSSIKVNGEASRQPFGPHDSPRPQDAYGSSKLRGEQLALAAGRAGNMQVAVVRPPLVYGPHVKANFLRLLELVSAGWPLPLAAIVNRRSLVNVWNLCDLLLRLLAPSTPPGRVWMVSDGEDLSTPELIRKLAAAMQRRARLFWVPPALLRAGGALSGRRAEVARLCDSLTVDIAETRSALGWAPPLSVDQGLARTAAWYASRGSLHA
jgi:nucleoside-diphosphate-sugar epimerase